MSSQGVGVQGELVATQVRDRGEWDRIINGSCTQIRLILEGAYDLPRLDGVGHRGERPFLDGLVAIVQGLMKSWAIVNTVKLLPAKAKLTSKTGRASSRPARIKAVRVVKCKTPVKAVPDEEGIKVHHETFAVEYFQSQIGRKKKGLNLITRGYRDFCEEALKHFNATGNLLVMPKKFEVFLKRDKRFLRHISVQNHRYVYERWAKAHGCSSRSERVRYPVEEDDSGALEVSTLEEEGLFSSLCPLEELLRADPQGSSSYGGEMAYPAQDRNVESQEGEALQGSGEPMRNESDGERYEPMSTELLMKLIDEMVRFFFFRIQ